jgi:hypothetical protein
MEFLQPQNVVSSDSVPRLACRVRPGTWSVARSVDPRIQIYLWPTELYTRST